MLPAKASSPVPPAGQHPPYPLRPPPSPKFLEVLQFALFWSEGAPSCNTSPYSLLDTPLWQSRLERSQAAT